MRESYHLLEVNLIRFQSELRSRIDRLQEQDLSAGLLMRLLL